jgi:hypothetical protein
MKKTGTWGLAGALSGALTVLFIVMMGQYGVKGYGRPALEALPVLKHLAWGAAYAVCFYVLARHFMPAATLAAGLVYALLPFLATVLFLPLYFKDPVVSDPLKVATTALNSVFYSVVMVWLGRQLEK